MRCCVIMIYYMMPAEMITRLPATPSSPAAAHHMIDYLPTSMMVTAYGVFRRPVTPIRQMPPHGAASRRVCCCAQVALVYEQRCAAARGRIDVYSRRESARKRQCVFTTRPACCSRLYVLHTDAGCSYLRRLTPFPAARRLRRRRAREAQA